MQTASNDINSELGIGPRGGGFPGSTLRVVMAVIPVALVALVAARLLGTALLSAWASVSASGPAAVDELLILVVTTLAACLATWFLGGVALELVAQLPGRCGRAAGRLSRRVTPTLARRTAGFVLGVGVGVVGGPTQALAVGTPPSVVTTAVQPHSERAPNPGFRAAPASAAPAPAPAPAPPTVVSVADPPPPAAPGFTPTPPRVRPQADPTLIGGHVAAPGDEDEVVVHRCDSLWSIAARHLGPGASDAEVDHSWRQWFALNRDVVGVDPDLLLPGQVLRVPSADHSSTVPR